MISLTIECETTEDYFDTLQKLMAGTAMPATADPNIRTAANDNVVAMTTTSGKKNKPKIVEKPAEPEPEAKVETTEVEQATVDNLADSLEEEGEIAPVIKLTQDNVRALAVRYANATVPKDAANTTDGQSVARTTFQELLAHFGNVKKFTEIPAEKWPEVVDYVTEQRVKRKLPADAVTE